MRLANLIPSALYRIFAAEKIQKFARQQGGITRAGFPGAQVTQPHFLLSDPLHLTGFTLYYNGGAGQLAVLKVKESVERGSRIVIVAKNISDMTARDFILAGASVNLIDFDTRPIRMFNLISDGIIVHAILRGGAGYGQVLDLKREEKAARDKGARAYSIVYVLGSFSADVVARTNSKGIPYKKGKGKSDDIIEAGGCPVDWESVKKNRSDSTILAYALEG